MGQYQRHGYDLGWLPSVDAFDAPPNALLRADNLVLDELGAVALRQGSTKLNTTTFTRTYGHFEYTGAFETTFISVAITGALTGIAQFTQEWERAYLTPSMPGDGPANHNHGWEETYLITSITIDTDTDVHTLSTASLNGTRYRMAGVDDAVYANDVAIWASLAGSEDVSFGTHMGHILFARSTTKRKFDGTTVRPWGISAPTAAPVLTALSTVTTTLSTCASGESPAMTSNEGTQTFQTDRSGNATAAVQIAPDATTGRGVSTKTFAAPTSFAGPDEDLLDMYVRVAEPQYITSITVMIDVNGGLFQEDYYEHTFVMGDSSEVIPSVEDSLASNYDVEGQDRDQVISRTEGRQIVTQFRPEAPTAATTGYNHFSIPRGSMVRSGLTTGKNWSTVEAVRLVVNAIAGGTGAGVRFDDINIIGGTARTLTGKYKGAIVAVRNDGTYQALSGPSTFSNEIEVKAQGIRATLAASAVDALDAQVNELHLYLMGGGMNAFYRASVKTGGPFGGVQTIDATDSEITMLAANIRMETDNTTPPDGIIGIEGPHFDRTLCLTAQYIYPSRQLNPDSYATGEVIRVGDASETALWIKKRGDSTVFVGTTRDIYRFDGDWTVLPDGSINIFKRPLGVKRPPISNAVTIGTVNNVEEIIYLTSDGWQVLQGPLLIGGSVDLLWRGFTRHDVSPVSITGRMRVSVSKNVLFALTPEGASFASTATLHVYHFSKQRWYRFTYPQAFRSLYAEPDGTLIAGDTAGFVRQLDVATKQDDGVNIPVVLRTSCDDNGQSFTYKDPENLWMRLDTGGSTATVAFHLNGNDTADSSATTAQSTTDTANKDVSTTNEFQQLQLRITGSFSTFIFRGWGLRYLDLPIPQVYHDTGFVDLSKTDENKWVRAIEIKARSPVDFTVTPYWDGGTGTVTTVSASAGTTTVYRVPLGREDRAKVARTVITSSQPSHVYWVKYIFRGTGRPLEKTISLMPEAS